MKTFKRADLVYIMKGCHTRVWYNPQELRVVKEEEDNYYVLSNGLTIHADCLELVGE